VAIEVVMSNVVTVLGSTVRMQESDEALVDVLRRENTPDDERERAARELVRRHREGVVNQFYRLGHDIHMAEDLAQETFLQVLRGVHTFDTTRAFKPWLYAIARNVWAREIRKGWTRPRNAGEGEIESKPAPGTEVDTQIDRETMLAKVRDLLAGYPSARARECFELHYFSGLEYPQIAERMSVVEGTVRGWISEVKVWLIRRLNPGRDSGQQT
jgi:RNA polymerase sigma-70 factor (ECF subfamily)